MTSPFPLIYRGGAGYDGSPTDSSALDAVVTLRTLQAALAGVGSGSGGGGGAGTDQTARDAAAAASASAAGKLSDLSDVTVTATTGPLAAGATSNIATAAAGSTYTAPALDNPLPSGAPKRFAVKAPAAGPVSVTFPNDAGVSTTAVVAAGEVLTLRQKTVSGWGAESGNKPMSFFDKIRGLPSWAPSGITKSYDATRQFLGSGADLVRARIDLNKARTGLGQFHCLGIGDSHTSGALGAASTPTFSTTINYFGLLKTLLVAAGIPLCGTGWVKFTDTSTALTANSEPRWTVTGSWTRSSGKHATASANGAVSTLTGAECPGGVGSHAAFCYSNGGSPMDWAALAADGTTVLASGTVTPGTDNTYQVFQTNVAGIASFRVTAKGTSSRLSAGRIWTDAAGVEMHNLGLYGSAAEAALAGWEDSSVVSPGIWAQLMMPDPSLIVGTLGGNDIVAGATPAQIKPALITTLGRWPNAARLMLGNWQGFGVTDANFGAYMAMWYSVIEGLGNAALLDVYTRSGGYTNLLARGAITTGEAHPNQIEHSDVARAMLALLTV